MELGYGSVQGFDIVFELLLLCDQLLLKLKFFELKLLIFLLNLIQYRFRCYHHQVTLFNILWGKHVLELL